MKTNVILLVIFLIFCSRAWTQVFPSNMEYLDTTFNKTGTIRGIKKINSFSSGQQARALAVDSKGRIVATTSSGVTSSVFVHRLQEDGTPDATFGSVKVDLLTSGIQYLYCSSVLLQKDGKIILGGSAYTTTSPTPSYDYLVIRLKENGALDSSFNSKGFITINLVSNQADEVHDMALQSDGKIILAGQSRITSNSIITLVRLNTDGTVDNSFNNNKGSFLSDSTSDENATGVEIFKDTIIVGGNYYDQGNTYFTVLKFLPNGSLLKRFDLTATSSEVANGLAVRTDGKIFIAGTSFNANGAPSFKVTGLYPNGKPYLSYQQSIGFNPTLTDLSINNDSSTLLSGYTSASFSNGNPTSIAFIKLDKYGKLDSTFANNGNLIITPDSLFLPARSTLSQDHKLILCGQYGSAPGLAKIQVKPVLHIMGSAYVQNGKFETYRLSLPASWRNSNYTWSYTGKNFTYVPDSLSASVTLLFSEAATSGTLTCRIGISGVQLGRISMDIFVNNNPSNVVKKVVCPPQVADCSLGYIDDFSFNSIHNIHSGCSNNGYTDYTQSNYSDTLASGGVYSAVLNIPNSGNLTNYAGIWIDYNNDGDFSNIDEFVGEGMSNDARVEVNNIILKNKEGYEGPKRLRVRSSPHTKFNDTLFCPLSNQPGETEDYLIVLNKQPVVEAPQIITPNEDGKNDYFVIRGLDPKLTTKLTIFDRLGTLKYSASEYGNDWNGTDSAGDRLQPGTYYYVFTSGGNFIKGFLEIRY